MTVTPDNIQHIIPQYYRESNYSHISELDGIIYQLSQISLSNKVDKSSCKICKCFKQIFSAIAAKIMNIYRKIFSIYNYVNENDNNGKKILLGIPEDENSRKGKDIALVPFIIDADQNILKDGNNKDVVMPKVFSQDWQRFIGSKIPFKVNKKITLINDKKSILHAINLLKSTLGEKAAIATARFLCQTATADITKEVNEKFSDPRFDPADPDQRTDDDELKLYSLSALKAFNFDIKVKNNDVKIKISSIFRKRYFYNQKLFGHSINGISTYTIPLKTLTLLGAFNSNEQYKIPLDIIALRTKYQIITRERPV